MRLFKINDGDGIMMGLVSIAVRDDGSRHFIPMGLFPGKGWPGGRHPTWDEFAAHVAARPVPEIPPCQRCGDDPPAGMRCMKCHQDGPDATP